MYLQHPLSQAFPAMDAEDRQALKDSIEDIGVQNPITLLDGMVIDGWHRYSIASELGLPCPSVTLEADTDPRAFVVAQNKARRHITAAQIALAVIKVYAWVLPGANQHSTRGSATVAEPLSRTNQELSDLSGVGVRTIERAKRISQQGTPEVKDALSSGQIGIATAEAMLQLPANEQAAAIAQPALRPTRAVKPRKARPEPTAPTPSAEPTDEEGGPSLEELAAMRAEQQANEASFQKLLDADDRLATAAAEIKQLNAMVVQLNRRVAGLMGEKSEAIALVKKLQRQIDKHHKEERHDRSDRNTRTASPRQHAF